MAFIATAKAFKGWQLGYELPAGSGWGKKWGKNLYGFQPISILGKPLETVPHVVQQVLDSGS